SLEVGPEHIDTSAGFFLIANIFYAQRKVESSLAFYDKVVDIWYKFLASVRNDANLAENVGKAQLSEGMDMLTRVLNTRVNLLGDTHIATGEARCTLGLLHLFVADTAAAIDHLTLASEIYTQQLGSDHASTQDVVDILVQLGGPRPRPLGLEAENTGENNNNNDNNGEDVGSPATLTVDVEKEGEEGASAGEGKLGDQGASQLSMQDSGASLLSQFPPTQEMPRAVMQSPIPLPPGGEPRVQPEPDDDAMRMSPPASAG
ncbi:unnamed protein product, partial [Ectocarpus sp. 8 AP-2014]